MSNLYNINEMLVEIFNCVLKIEEKALLEGPFKDISVTEVHTLDAIGLHSKKTMSEVAKKLNITLGTLTTSINNLVRKEYVVRNKDEFDKRVVLVSLTKKGRYLYRVHENFHSKIVGTVLEGVTEEDKEVLYKSLTNLHLFLQNELNK
ncbi:MAG: MarR family winged helix-turn-helix transcriptional regulator [Lachnospirales bacterium]